MCIAVAILGAAAIGAAGSAIAGSEAASATTSASNAAIAEQQNALQQQEALAAPYTQLGQSAIAPLQNLLGLGPQGAAGETAALQATPGYQFTQQQGTQATTNAASAMGLTLSGNTLEGLSEFNTGLADQTYQQQVSNLQNVVNTGEGAAAGVGANIGTAATNIGNIAVSQGNNIAGIDENVIAGLTKSVGNAGNQYIAAQTLANLNNVQSGYQPTLQSSPGGYLEWQ